MARSIVQMSRRLGRNEGMHYIPANIGTYTPVIELRRKFRHDLDPVEPDPDPGKDPDPMDPGEDPGERVLNRNA